MPLVVALSVCSPRGTTGTSRGKLTEEVQTCHKEEFPARGGCLWGLELSRPEGCPLEGFLCADPTKQTRDLPFASWRCRLLWVCKVFSDQDLFWPPREMMSDLPPARRGFAPAIFCQQETRLKKHFGVGHLYTQGQASRVCSFFS